MLDKVEKRLIKEKAKLDVKIFALRRFLETDTYDELHGDSRELLLSQVAAMSWYSDVLGERIQEFTG